MAPWLDLEWRGKSVTFYLAFKVQGTKDSLGMFKGAPPITLGLASGLWPGERHLGGEHSTWRGLFYAAPLDERSEEKGEGPRALPLHFQRPPPPCSWQSTKSELPHRGLSLAGLSPITAHAKIAVWEPGPARPRPSISG